MYNFVILIPSFNEEKTLNIILKKLKTYKVIVVDDCSFDNTNKLKNKYKRVKFIYNKQNLGYEFSLLKGFQYIKNKDFDYVLTLDADGEHSISNINKFFNYCNKFSPDLIVGNRTRKNRFSEKTISLLFNLKYKILDPLSGFKIYNIKKLSQILKNYKKNKCFLVDILYLFIKRKMNILSINIKSNSMPKRKSNLGGSFFVNLKIFKCVIYLI